MNSGKMKMLRLKFGQLLELSATHTEGRRFMKCLKHALVIGAIGLTAIPAQAEQVCEAEYQQTLQVWKSHALKDQAYKRNQIDKFRDLNLKARCDIAYGYQTPAVIVKPGAESRLKEAMKSGASKDDINEHKYYLSLDLLGKCATRHREAQCRADGYGGNAAGSGGDSTTKSTSRTADASPPATASGTGSSSTSGNLSSQQVTSCSEEIKNKQIESQSWGGNVDDVAARLGQFQKSLFEGRCKGHPEAQAYIAGANKMIGYGGNATGSGGGSQPPLASGSASGSGSTDRSRSRKVHNPAADAKGCVDLIQSGVSRNWKFVNKCGTAIEVFWCFVQNDGRCRNGGTWSVRSGWDWSSQGNQPIKWGACRGKNSGGMDDDSNGDKYTCHLLQW